ncbi:MAG: ATP-binding cassette domain-containing protein [Burkholderiaceae bacterium]
MIDVDISLTVSDGQRRFDVDARFAADVPVVALYGPSGAGKSLTLRALAGLLRPITGCIRLADRTLFDSQRGVDLPAHARRVGYVFQNYALFPHLSVRDNVAFGLTTWRKGLGKVESERVEAIMRDLEIAPLAASRPSTLSGGQQQRVALARALVCRPDVLLLDEPFAALHPMLRARLRSDLKQIEQNYSIPMVMISHDLEDVAALADVMFVMEAGQVTREVDVRDRTALDREVQPFRDAAASERVGWKGLVGHG